MDRWIGSERMSTIAILDQSNARAPSSDKTYFGNYWWLQSVEKFYSGLVKQRLITSWRKLFSIVYCN